ncbi:hypothetical protein H6F94_21025 [Leptolyngbya sp. FACHB-261]|nr:hypothetical protein [Leptolyngbya sp. FACHB-261]
MPLFQGFQEFWQYLLRAIMNRSELQIWQGLDRFGNVCWHIYDPKTGRSLQADSEAEVRTWIEQQYYQQR